MKKIILIPDSFKGTLSAVEVCQIMEARLRPFFPETELRSVPVADGGEGTVEAWLMALGGEKVSVTVTGPHFEKQEAFYGVLPDGKTAVIEMAACAGLPLVEGTEAGKNPALTTTYGVGELMAHALESGCTHLILGLGGSCTNDCGAGAAAALGIRFSRGGTVFVPTGGTLSQVEKIDFSQMLPGLSSCSIAVMCDIDNPLTGPSGAATVFAPQKGADSDMVEALDRGLAEFAIAVKRETGTDFSQYPGAGAAGGMGFGMKALLGAKLESGIETLLDAVSFDALLEDCDLVFTGEGKMDGQTARGKVAAGVARRCKRAHVPVIAVVGQIAPGAQAMYDVGLTAMFSCNPAPVPFSQARLHAKENLGLTMENLARLLALQ